MTSWSAEGSHLGPVRAAATGHSVLGFIAKSMGIMEMLKINKNQRKYKGFGLPAGSRAFENLRKSSKIIKIPLASPQLGSPGWPGAALTWLNLRELPESLADAKFELWSCRRE